MRGMKTRVLHLVALTTLCVTAGASSMVRAEGQIVTLVDKPGERRVDVLVDGKPFTSYLYPTTLEKPVLYPIRSGSGAVVTRGYPLEPKAGERPDHPHHVGHWFNYGDVNGFDFWGHSSATPAANKARMGTIVHKTIKSLVSGKPRGELAVTADWNVADGSTLLREETRFVFTGEAGRRAIDRMTTWTAADKALTFNDTKEGAFAIRVARTLEHPSKVAEVLISDTNPKETVKKLDTANVKGQYIGSDGKTGEAVWGTPGPWMGLIGHVDGKPVTIAILDHPSNYGHPTYWHARGYGLFAANPIGRQGYDPKQPPRTLTLQPGQAATFRHRILVLDRQMTHEELQKEFTAFAGDALSAARE